MVTEELKRRRNVKIIIYVLLIAIITSIIISGAYARYTAKAEGDGIATVAKWSFKVDGLDNDTITPAVAVEHIADGKIAPGTSGAFDIIVDAEGCEVALTYIIEIMNITNKPENLKFYEDSNYETEVIPETIEGKDIYTIKGTMLLPEIETTPRKTVSIYWKWDYETADGDRIDTDDGIEAAKMAFEVKVTGMQAIENENIFFKAEYINGTDNMTHWNIYEKTQEDITTEETTLLSQLSAIDTTTTYSRAIQDKNNEIIAIGEETRTSTDEQIYLYSKYTVNSKVVSSTYSWDAGSLFSR